MTIAPLARSCGYLALSRPTSGPDAFLCCTESISFRHDLGLYATSEIKRGKGRAGVRNVVRPATVRLRSNPRQRKR